jgi:hypothetical protein
MRSRLVASLSELAMAAAAAFLVPVSFSGQAPAARATKTWTPPRTPDGQPDLQGNWISRSATPLERPKQLEGRPFLTDAEVAELKKRAGRIFSDNRSSYAGGDNAFLAALANVELYEATTTGKAEDMIEREFDNRTSLIVDPADGKIPPLTEAGRRRLAEGLAKIAVDHPPSGPEDLTNYVRCITFGVPRLGGNFGAGPFSYYQFVQAPGYVIVVMEAIHDARIIPLNGSPHLPPGIRTWNGDSRGRWEGQTLVVDTTNFSPQSYFLGSAENLHLVERFTRIAPDEIRYEITLDDLTTWTKPWTAALRLKQTQEKIYEYACHEGNRVLEEILVVARAQEKAAEQAATKPSQ